MIRSTDPLESGRAALGRGDWLAARIAFERALQAGEDPEALEGLGDDPAALRGPGRLARAFELAVSNTGMDLVRSTLHLRAGEPVLARGVVRSRRIGIADSTTSERPWRFSVRGSAGVTR